MFVGYLCISGLPVKSRDKEHMEIYACVLSSECVSLICYLSVYALCGTLCDFALVVI